jgi:hypothetical protein
VGTIKVAFGSPQPPNPFFQVRKHGLLESEPMNPWHWDSVPNSHGFGTAHPTPTSFVIRFPHWLAAFIFALLVPLPWIRRFSIRTLLIGVTIIAVVLGLLMWGTPKNFPS